MEPDKHLPEMLDRAVTKEEYDEFDDRSHRSRLHWLLGDRTLKPKVVNGRRVDLSGKDDK